MSEAGYPHKHRQVAEDNGQSAPGWTEAQRNDQGLNIGSRRVSGESVTHRAKLCAKTPERVQENGETEAMQKQVTWMRPEHTDCQSVGWWAVYTRHQHEKTVAGLLENKGFEVFLPLYESERRWKDRLKTLSLPLFPSYVFVRGEVERRLQIVSTPGAHMIVSNGSQFSEIPDGEIEAIRLAVSGPHRVEPHPLLKSGDWVRVIRGPLEGLEGILLRRRSSCRLVLTVSMLAQSAAVEVNAFDVEPIVSEEEVESTTKLNTKHGLLPSMQRVGNLREQSIAVAL